MNNSLFVYPLVPWFVNRFSSFLYLCQLLYFISFYKCFVFFTFALCGLVCALVSCWPLLDPSVPKNSFADEGPENFDPDNLRHSKISLIYSFYEVFMLLILFLAMSAGGLGTVVCFFLTLLGGSFARLWSTWASSSGSSLITWKLPVLIRGCLGCIFNYLIDYYNFEYEN